MSTPQVIVIGDVDTDIFYKIPRLPGPDEGVLAEEVFERPGGKGANTAAALSRLGTPTGLLSVCGDDHYGDVARAGLVCAGVEISHLNVVPGGHTYYCLALLDPSGEKALVVVITPQIYPDEFMIHAATDSLKNARHVHTIGLNPSRMIEGLKIARAAGLSTSTDLDSLQSGLDVAMPLIQESTWVFINRHGAEKIAPGRPDIAARRLHELGAQEVIVTLGSAGCIAFDGALVVSAPGLNVPVVDTTGAGDCFSGAFIHARLNGYDLSGALRFACAAAAISTRAFGGQGGQPGLSEVLEMLQ